ncbi:hypothetical protein [Sorangium sp. So ce1078]|uniref:hypothetical protein n=1 Tax=Sorangium sp. So ce1078 TaxID=3133329 RepID=UPI003F640E5A
MKSIRDLRFFSGKVPHINNLCTKMVPLEALLDAGAVSDGISIVEIARRSHSILTRSPELSRDPDGVAGLGRQYRGSAGPLPA